MKYCKKCFRNVREDVSVCPYCGAPGLTEYGSHNSGEDFTCSQPKALEREIEQNIEDLQPKKDAAYTYKDEDKDDSIFNMFDDEDKEDPYEENNSEDPYGNTESRSDCNEPEVDAYGSKRHTDDSCDNAPDTPKKVFLGAIPSPDNPNIKMRIEYLNMLKKIDGITPQRIEELMRKYDETHGNYTGKFTTITYKTKTTNQNTAANGTAIAYIIAMFFALIFGFANPFFGIIIMIAIKSKLKKLDLPGKDKLDRTLNVLILIFVIILIGYGVLAVLSSFAGGGALISV